ncbi:MAG: hypothetical protein JW828_01810 [Sedimentisphaerales bacterium]|nr:hypothetical protein [Sedimentisphaerales bacterium]
MAIYGVTKLLILLFMAIAVGIIIALAITKRGSKVIPVLLAVGGAVVGLLFVLRFFGFAVVNASSHAGNGIPRIGVFPIVFLPVIMAFVVIIAAIAKSKNPGKIFAGILVFCVVSGLLALGFLTVSHTRVATVPYDNQPAGSTVEAAAEQIHDSHSIVSDMPAFDGIPAVWHEGVEQEMPADMYPSQEAAVSALARQTGKLVDKVLAGEQISTQAELYGNDFVQLQLFQRTLNDRFGIDTQIIQRTEAPTSADFQLLPQNKLIFKLRKEEERFHYLLPDDAETRQLQGLFVLTVTYFDRLAQAQVRYHEKPWLTDFPQFQSQHRNHSYLLARSTSSATSQAQAEREAMTQATRQVAHMINEIRIRTPNRMLESDLSVNPVDLERRGMIFDRFTQQFYAAAGPIYRTALLIDTSEMTMAPLVQEKTAIMRLERITWAKMILTFLGIAGLICIVYAFLNAATRGYYTWSLRIAAVVLGLIGLFVILNFA